MRNHVRAISCATVLAIGASVALAQPASPGALPPVRPLGKTTASSTELLTAVSQVRALPDGRVIVNDNGGRKVVLFDAALSKYTVIADTTSATANAYSSRAAGIVEYKGDSTLFIDPQSLSMLVIDGKGSVARVMAVPRPSDAVFLVGGSAGTPGFDAQGRIVYRAAPSMRLSRPAAPNPNGPTIPSIQFPDSATLIRVDLATRKLDTVAQMQIPKQNISLNQTPEGRMGVTVTINPLQYSDDWAVTSDGRVAIVRGHEYRIDWIGADGSVTSSKVPFAWRQLSDSAKSVYLDSAKASIERLVTDAGKRMQSGDMSGAAAVASAMMPAEASMFMGMGMRAGAEVAAQRGAAPAPAGGAPARGGPGAPQMPTLLFVGASELPDYAPPFTAGAVRGDADGNVWIRTTIVYDGGSVYDVVNAKGQLTDRVLLPPGRVIAGFGKGGVVYMGVRVDKDGVRLERATLR